MAIYSHILFVNKNVCHILKIKKYDSVFHFIYRLNRVFIGEVKGPGYLGLSAEMPQTTEYDDYIVKQTGILYKNQKVSPEEINLRYDALKRKEMFKEITDIKFNTFVAYRHLIAIPITFENDHGKSVYHYLKKEGLF